jgi:L-alanine-DL-glutamate epimerase-like enolase superfamily enzyme
MFPPDALSCDTWITVEMVTDGTLGVELEPHGIQFNKPVIIETDLTGTTGEGQGGNTATLWYNEVEDWWELIPSLGGDANTQRSELHHFSKYKVGSLG